MERIAPLIIHRGEWERIQNQARLASPDTEKVPCQDIDAMIAQSRKWLHSWPDSVQGYVNKVRMKKKKTHMDEIAKVKALHKMRIQDTTAENLKRARDMIFERTGYGKELLSALIESKTLEERDIQIKFKKEIQEKEKMIEEAKSKVDNIMYAEFEKGERNRLLQKDKERADAECNKMIADMKNEEVKRAAEIEKTNRHEAEEMIQKLQQLEILEEKCPDSCLDKEADKLYEEQNKAIKEMREKREILDQVLADVWRKHQDRVRCREQQVMDQIHKEKHKQANFKEHYKLVQNLQEEEQRKYNDFIEKGIKEMERRLVEKEKEEKFKQDQQRKSKTLKKECVQFKKQRDSEIQQRKIPADRQSLLRLSRLEKDDTKLRKERPPLSRTPAQFLAPSTALQEALAQRRLQPSGWSGAGAEHARFARRAAATLAEAVYKRPVWKVIDSYQKKNNIKDLAIPNY